MASYTDQEMHEREQALARVHTIADWYSMQPKYVSRWAKPGSDRVAQAVRFAQGQPSNAGTGNLNTGKVMQARYAGRCAQCGGAIAAGETIVYDGKARHTVCPTEDERLCEDCGLRPVAWADSRYCSECGAERDFHHGVGQEGWDDAAEDRWAAGQGNGVPAGSNDHASFSSQEERYYERRAGTDEPAPKFTDTIPATAPAAEPREGRFTVVIAGDRRTFKVERQAEDEAFMPGKLVISYLNGPDNWQNYASCGMVSNGRLVMWKKFRGGDLERFAQVLMDPTAASGAGLAYALESGNCCICGRTLTVPASINMGMGPKCAKGGRD